MTAKLMKSGMNCFDTFEHAKAEFGVGLVSARMIIFKNCRQLRKGRTELTVLGAPNKVFPATTQARKLWLEYLVLDLIVKSDSKMNFDFGLEI